MSGKHISITLTLSTIFLPGTDFVSAESSSFYRDSVEYYGPLLAIDGIVSPEHRHLFHSLLDETNPWLRVTLREETLIESVTILHRIDCCMERFQNVAVTLIRDGVVQCGDVYQGPLPPDTPQTTFVCQNPAVALHIKVSMIARWGGTLMVNEIRVNEQQQGSTEEEEGRQTTTESGNADAAPPKEH